MLVLCYFFFLLLALIAFLFAKAGALRFVASQRFSFILLSISSYLKALLHMRYHNPSYLDFNEEGAKALKDLFVQI